MATSTAQRIGIGIIAIVMVIGTIGSFAIMIVANKNAQADSQKQQATYQKQMEEAQKKAEEAQKKADEIAAKLSPKYFATFNSFKSVPEPFDASKVTKLETKDLKVGDGAEVKAVTDLNVYYIGWNAKGKVFDSSLQDTTLKAPLDPSGGTIEGFSKGLIGMKIGGVRVITIPADQAYGAQSPAADIPANSPLKFLVMAISPQNS